ncbi:MAG: nuclease family protein [Acidobacteriales bacterium]|nr:nuclease family protein [Terriglobales bacterium]
MIRYDSNKKWKEMLQQGLELLAKFQEQGRVRILQPWRNLNVKATRRLSSANDFLGYVDGIGYLDGTRSILEWKTTSSRYPEQPAGLLSLDPQLICYSWLTGIAQVSLICFVRKRVPEIQYLSAVISEEQRNDYGCLVESTVAQIEAANFSAHSGIRFPHSACLGCRFIGLCLNNQQLIEARLKRRPGAEDLDWINQLAA